MKLFYYQKIEAIILKSILILISILLVFSLKCNAFYEDAVYVFKSKDISYSLNHNMHVEDAIVEKNWQDYSKDITSLSIIDKPIWLKIKIEKNFSEKIFFSLRNPLLDEVSVYGVQNGVIKEYFQFGDHTSENYKGQYYRSMNIDPLSELTFYIKVKTTGLLYLPFEISDEFNFFDHSFEHNLILGVFLGALFFFFLFGLMMSIITNQSMYLNYVFFTFGMFILYLYQEGLFVGLISNPLWHDHLYPYINAFVVLTCSLFNISYTQIKVHSKFVYRLMCLPAIIAVLFMFLIPFIDTNTATIIGLFNFGLITVISLVASLYLAFIVNVIEGRFLLLSIVFFIPGSTLYVFGIMGMLDLDFYPKYFMQIGHTIELFVWTIALGVKVYSMRDIIDNQQHDLHYNSLTQILNRKGINHEVAKIINDTRIQYFSVAILDIDHFKKINDTMGHDAGDKALQYFSSFLKFNIREQDILGRWGGEEFVIILPNTNNQESNNMISRILLNINECPYVDNEYNIPIKFSAGIACGNRSDEDEFDFAALLHSADKKLYKAKESGRNKVLS